MRSILTLALLSSAWSVQATPIMSLTPSMNTMFVRSDGYAVVQFTLTNELSSRTLNGINVILPNSSQYSLVSDQCTGTNLNAAQSCTFNLMVNGSNIHSNLSISPRVCAENGTVCSQPYASDRPQLNYIPVDHPVRAYIGLSNYTPISSMAVFSVGTNTLEQEFTAPEMNFTQGGVVGSSVSLNGNYFYCTNNNSNSLLVMDVTQTTPVILAEIPYATSAQPVAVVVDLTNQHVYAGAYPEASISIINPNTYVVEGTISLDPSSYAGYLVISPDNKRLYMDDGGLTQIIVFDITTNPPIATEVISLTYYPITVSIDPTNTILYVPNSTDGTVHRYDIQNDYVELSALDASAHLSDVSYMVFSPSGEIGYIADSQNVMPYDLTTLTPLLSSPISIGYTIESITPDPSGRYLYVTPLGQAYVYIIDTTDYSVKQINIDPNSQGLTPVSFGFTIG